MKPVSVWALPDWTMSWICSIGPTEFCSRLAGRSTFRPTLCRIMSGMLGRCSTSRAGRKLGKRPGAIDRIFLAHSVTGSSGAQGQRDLIQRVINAMGTIEIDVVATTGPNLNVADLRAPKNVHLLRGAPHDAVMKDVSLVVTQGGHGTVCRALINGLPQLILPNGRDQGDNAARVEVKGAGLRLPPTASETEIAAAVKRLVGEPYFRASARRLGNAIKAEIGSSSLVREMEAIVAARREAEFGTRRRRRA
jgi:UDP-N-acetylglucosamine:LPS N-acetylglucosamine transferase